MRYIFKLTLRKLIVLILILLIIILVFSVSKKEKKTEIDKRLYGKNEVTINFGETYKDEGYKLIINGIDKTDEIEIINNVDYTKIGTYEIIYKYNNEVLQIRKITIVDNMPPTIALKGNSEISIVETTTYNEEGYEVTDNYDKEIQNKVIIEGTVDPKKVGTYTLKYIVTDESNNKAEITRKINVTKKPVTIVKKVVVEQKEVIPVIKLEEDTVTYMKWTNSGFILKGCTISSEIVKSIYLNETPYEINGTNNCYDKEINISSLTNGTYDIYLETNVKKDNLKNIQTDSYKIKRSKINDKLVTFNYDNNNMKVVIENFNYDYDILIDVGHGGFDSGATNIYKYEKDINLEISLYEKQRYEQMGLTVKLSRDDDTYGMMMGDTTAVAVRQRAYAVGYYGVKSRLVYSNHHNSNGTASYYGYEMIVPADKSNLQDEYNIREGLKTVLRDNTIRIYTKDYDTDTRFYRNNNEIYYFKNWYALNRIPYELFNVYVTIHEPAHMSNVDEFLWYYLSGNWKKVSEVKIKIYVERLGKTYIAP